MELSNIAKIVEFATQTQNNVFVIPIILQLVLIA